MVSSDKAQAIECALLARQQFMGGGKLIRVSQLKKKTTKDTTLPFTQQEHGLRTNSPFSKDVREWIGISTAIDEATSTRSPLSSHDAWDLSILGEDELGTRPIEESTDFLSTAIQSVKQLYSSLSLQLTCGNCYTACASVMPGRGTATGTFDGEVWILLSGLEALCL